MKNINILVIALLLQVQMSYAQNSDELDNLYKEAYEKLNKPEEATIILQDYISLAQKLKNENAEGQGYQLLAYLFKKEGNNIKAAEYYFKSLRSAIITEDKELELHNLIRLGNIRYEILDYESARLFYEEALLITNDDSKIKADLFYALGLIARHTKNYQEAVNRYNEALRLYTSLDENLDISQINLEFAIIAKDQNRFEVAIGEFKSLSETAVKEKVRLKALNNLGNTYLDLGQLEKARQILEKTLQAKIESGGNLIPTYNNLAKIELQKNNKGEAETYLKLAANDIDGQVSAENEWTLSSLMTLYKEDQKPQQLMIYYDQHVALLRPLVKLYKELEIMNQQHAIWQIQFQYDQAQERYEVAIQKAIYKGIIIGAVVIILVVASFMIFYKKKHQKLRNKLKQSWKRMRKRAIESAAESKKILEEMGYKPGHFKGELPPSLRELYE